MRMLVNGAHLRGAVALHAASVCMGAPSTPSCCPPCNPQPSKSSAVPEVPLRQLLATRPSQGTPKSIGTSSGTSAAPKPSISRKASKVSAPPDEDGFQDVDLDDSGPGEVDGHEEGAHNRGVSPSPAHGMRARMAALQEENAALSARLAAVESAAAEALGELEDVQEQLAVEKQARAAAQQAAR